MTRKSEALLRFWRYRAETGKLPGRASRGCAVPSATLKQASCVVGPVARPSAAPADWETAFGGWELLGKPTTSLTANLTLQGHVIISKVSKGREAAFPIWRGGHRPCADWPLRAKRSFAPVRFGRAKCAVAHPRQFPEAAR